LKFQPKKSLRHEIACALLLAAATAQLHAQTAPAAAPATVAPPTVTLNVTSYVVEGNMPLSADEVQKIVAPFIGPARTLDQIESAARALEAEVRSRGYAFHRLYVPAQKPANGVVKLQVTAFTLGKVEVNGNQFFTNDNILKALPSLQVGEPPEVERLGRDVSASNANPAKQVTVTFKESTDPGKVDAAVKVQDVRPLSFYATLSANQWVSGRGAPQNTTRVGGILQHGNVFDRDHVMTLSYTTDPNRMSSVSQYGAYYQIPIYGRGLTLSGYYTKSDVNSGSVVQGTGVFNISGSGRFQGLRATQALDRWQGMQHTVSASLDDRLFINSTTFNGTPILPNVGAQVLGLQYAMRTELSGIDVTGTVDYVTNIGGGSSNTNAAYIANGGVRKWDAWRYSATANYQIPNWNLTARFKGQTTGKTLIAGEQFGLGGATTVRGLPDRIATGDTGFQYSFEAVGPALTSWAIRPAAFIDGGHTHSRGTGLTENVMSAGVGVRMGQQNYQISVDLAQVINAATASASAHPVRLNMMLTYRF